MTGQKNAFPKLKNFIIKKGLTNPQVDQLIKYANTDPLIKKYTSDRVRFKDLASYKSWLREGKTIYVLTNKGKDLLGILWFTKKASGFLHYPFTFAIRTYDKARGKGLASDFMKLSFKYFTNSQIYKTSREKGIWLEVSSQNVPAKKIYEEFGFKEAGQSKEGKLIMLYSPGY